MTAYSYIMPIALVFCFSCSGKKAESAFDKAAVATEVERAFDDYVTYVNTKGLKGADSFFSSDSRFYWVEDGVMQYPNRDALLSGIEEFYPSVEMINLQPSKTDIEILNSQTATIYVEYKQEIKLKSGYAFTLDGAMTIVMIPEDGSWKFLIGHSSVKKPRGGG